MRAIIIERWTILRHGLRSVLSQAGHPVLSAAATAAQGVAAVADAHDLDLVIVGQTDDLPITAVVTAVRAQVPAASLLALVDDPGPEEINDLLGAGSAGLLGRLAEGIEVLEALARLERGERVLSNEVIATLVSGVDTGDGPLAAPAPGSASLLTARESETLSLLSTGASNREIARRLFIGESTVKTHLVSIYAKLGVANRHQAVSRGLELGLLPLRGRRVVGRTT